VLVGKGRPGQRLLDWQFCQANWNDTLNRKEH
jgi:hypothetical protein